MSREIQLVERVYGSTGGVVGRSIRAVAVLNSRSANGRTYPRSTMERARKLFEGVRVYVDHQAEHLDEPRSVRDLIGKLEHVRLDDDGPTLRADLRVFAGTDGDRVIEIAKSDPDAAGLSINARGNVTDDDGSEVVEAITKVRSVDLVAEPAATSGIFEGRNADRRGGKRKPPVEDLKHIFLEDLPPRTNDDKDDDELFKGLADAING